MRIAFSTLWRGLKIFRASPERARWAADWNLRFPAARGLSRHGRRLVYRNSSWGLLLAAGGMQRLTRQCGRGVATRIMLEGDVLSVAEAFRVNLVEILWENDQAETELAVIAGRIAALPREDLGIVKGCIVGQGATDTDGFALEILALRNSSPVARQRSV